MAADNSELDQILEQISFSIWYMYTLTDSQTFFSQVAFIMKDIVSVHNWWQDIWRQNNSVSDLIYSLQYPYP